MPIIRLSCDSRSVIGSPSARGCADIDHAFDQLAAGVLAESARSTAGWPNRPFPDRCRARSDTTNRCAASACGPSSESTAERTGPPRSARRSSLPRPPYPPRPSRRQAPPACSASAITHMSGIERVRLVVDRLELLAALGPPHDDLAARPASENQTRAAAGRTPSARSS